MYDIFSLVLVHGLLHCWLHENECSCFDHYYHADSKVNVESDQIKSFVA